jgi:hypothetical protein
MPQEFYQLRTYTLRTGPQLALTENYFATALIPALNRLKLSPIGAFKLDIGPETPTYYLLISASSAEILAPERYLRALLHTQFYRREHCRAHHKEIPPIRVERKSLWALHRLRRNYDPWYCERNQRLILHDGHLARGGQRSGNGLLRRRASSLPWLFS